MRTAAPGSPRAKTRCSAARVPREPTGESPSGTAAAQGAEPATREAASPNFASRAYGRPEGMARRLNTEVLTRAPLRIGLAVAFWAERRHGGSAGRGVEQGLKFSPRRHRAAFPG